MNRSGFTSKRLEDILNGFLTWYAYLTLIFADTFARKFNQVARAYVCLGSILYAASSYRWTSLPCGIGMTRFRLAGPWAMPSFRETKTKSRKVYFNWKECKYILVLNKHMIT